MGVRPTVDDGDRVNVEGFILDFSGDLYGQTIRMEFYKRLRGERKFPEFWRRCAAGHAQRGTDRAYFKRTEER